jgi:hypothetical protein
MRKRPLSEVEGSGEEETPHLVEAKDWDSGELRAGALPCLERMPDYFHRNYPDAGPGKRKSTGPIKLHVTDLGQCKQSSSILLGTRKYVDEIPEGTIPCTFCKPNPLLGQIFVGQYDGKIGTALREQGSAKITLYKPYLEAVQALIEKSGHLSVGTTINCNRILDFMPPKYADHFEKGAAAMLRLAGISGRIGLIRNDPLEGAEVGMHILENFAGPETTSNFEEIVVRETHIDGGADGVISLVINVGYKKTTATRIGSPMKVKVLRLIEQAVQSIAAGVEKLDAELALVAGVMHLATEVGWSMRDIECLFYEPGEGAMIWSNESGHSSVRPATRQAAKERRVWFIGILVEDLMWPTNEAQCQTPFELITAKKLSDTDKDKLVDYAFWSTESPINFDGQKKVFGHEAAKEWITHYQKAAGLVLPH